MSREYFTSTASSSGLGNELLSLITLGAQESLSRDDNLHGGILSTLKHLVRAKKAFCRNSRLQLESDTLGAPNK